MKIKTLYITLLMFTFILSSEATYADMKYSYLDSNRTDSLVLKTTTTNSIKNHINGTHTINLKTVATNNSSFKMPVKFYLAHFYLIGITNTDSTSFEGLPGTSYHWNSNNNRFEIPGYETSMYTSLTINPGFSIVSRNIPEIEDALTKDWWSTVAGQGINFSIVPFMVKTIAVQNASDSVLMHDFGSLEPGQTKEINYTFTTYADTKIFMGDVPGYASFNVYSYSLPEPVTVKHVDESGNNLSDPDTLTGNIGDNYASAQKSIDGYTFKEVQGSATGTFTEDDQTVTYVYKKVASKVAAVTVKHVDESGNTLSDPDTLTGNIGDNYASAQKSIDGYTFKEVQGSATGTFTEDDQTVTYVYKKVASKVTTVTVKHVDESGNTLSDPDTLTGNIGDNYASAQKSIDGYTFKEVQGSATGTFTEDDQTVTYVYKKVKESVEPKKNLTSNDVPTNGKKNIETIQNNSKDLPKTGDSLFLSYIMLGSSLIILSGSLFLFRPNKKNE